MSHRTALILATFALFGSLAAGQENGSIDKQNKLIVRSTERKQGDKVISMDDSVTLTTDSKVVTKLSRGTVATIREIDDAGARMLVRASVGNTQPEGWTALGDWMVLSSASDQANLDTLMRERVLALQEQLAALESNFKDADGNEVARLLDLLTEVNKDLISAELEIYQNPVDRIERRERFLLRARNHERIVKLWNEASRRGGEADKEARVRAVRIGAEIDLLRERQLAAKRIAGQAK